MSQWKQEQFKKGMEVYSSADEDLGHIENIFDDCIQVQKGIIFHKDRYIPYDAIASVDADANRVYLLVSKAEAKEMQWDLRPSEKLADPVGYTYDQGHLPDSPPPMA
ncbi:uncharacterized protein DUF2171 [Thermosporothrix hazakensis]|jgi:hypothetical protein|uniref:Uncharacterized protein DUF2171 n=2 Tax=Thermosporothrix TaxID=768650 RepID=A0A326U2W7_THEHA|nr:DUF2171 domain-containing protein [Thermosporothrix hazakensis]PZW24844.1 uncharacterized protein DUF2171 [Thermosporothrix hazakensis]BBH88279.1 hypothetical protein KTC_30300 [Thermosporothrix sp. COM3]GCE46466.1 hypothetical protein KTH_13350 [Thermosporothrix hazakensis]